MQQPQVLLWQKFLPRLSLPLHRTFRFWQTPFFLVHLCVVPHSAEEKHIVKYSIWLCCFKVYMFTRWLWCICFQNSFLGWCSCIYVIIIYISVNPWERCFVKCIYMVWWVTRLAAERRRTRAALSWRSWPGAPTVLATASYAIYRIRPQKTQRMSLPFVLVRTRNRELTWVYFGVEDGEGIFITSH